MKDVMYQKFVKRWEEVTDIPPQTIGPLTGLYRQITRRLKVMPWPAYVGAGALFTAALYYAFGSSVAGIVTLLQRGF